MTNSQYLQLFIILMITMRRLSVAVLLIFSPTFTQSHCSGGIDPTCYFRDPDEGLIDSYYNRKSRRIINPVDNSVKLWDQDNYTRIRRKEEKAVQEAQDEKKKEKSEEEVEEEYDENSKEIKFFPLKDGEIIQPKLRMYPPVGFKGWVYPPFTYHGFHSPKVWGDIPPWYFLPRTETKVGKYTGLLINEKSGISFMNFSSLHVKEVKIRAKNMMESNSDENEGESNDPLRPTKFGVSSINCSNTLFPAPLDIITANAKEDLTEIEFKFDNYATMYSFVMFRPEDGTDLLFVKLQTPPKLVSAKPSIEKGATTGDALFLDRISIHFGTDRDIGSEHRINGKSYGMELQFFFNTQDKFGETPYWKTLENYIIDQDPFQYGKHLLVLCVLVEVAPADEETPPPGKEYNIGLSYLAKAAESFEATNNVEMYRAKATKKKVLKIQDFFQGPKSGLYYTYYGCLTHPPCLNNTRYAVFEKPIYIRNEDWRKFIFIPSEFSDTSYIAGNYRPMDVMTFTDATTNTIVPYDSAAKEKLSHTVRRSRRSSEKERQAEYDYYEDIEGLSSAKNKGSKPKSG